MDHIAQDPIDTRLLNDWQRGLPLVSRPFSVLANDLEICESDVISRLKRFTKSGVVSRVGGVVRPNIIGASTLAAVSVPDLQVDEIAAVIGNEPGVNHLYLRENKVNLWFVATGPNNDHVSTALARIEKRIGTRVFDLRLERSYHIDLGFPLDERGTKFCEASDALDRSAALELQGGDSELVQMLTLGLQLEHRPFRSIATSLGRSETDVLSRLQQLCEAQIVKRIGVIVRHRALGWRSNAMVVWDVSTEAIDQIGATLARLPGISLCYRRTRMKNVWPYNLYCMVHAKARDNALELIASASETEELKGCSRQILFSTRCFKQTGAMLISPQEAG
jgi:siroheme decarboxylase